MPYLNFQRAATQDKESLAINMKCQLESSTDNKMRQLLASLLVAASAAVLFCQLTTVEGSVINSDCGSSKTHNFYFGKLTHFDRLLYRENIKYKSKWMRVTSVDVDYPKKGQTPLGNISYIEVLDQRTDGTGGCVYIAKGGVGNNFVTLKFKSQRNHGMDFWVNVYGH